MIERRYIFTRLKSVWKMKEIEKWRRTSFLCFSSNKFYRGNEQCEFIRLKYSRWIIIQKKSREISLFFFIKFQRNRPQKYFTWAELRSVAGFIHVAFATSGIHVYINRRRDGDPPLLWREGKGVVTLHRETGTISRGRRPLFGWGTTEKEERGGNNRPRLRFWQS